jgi:hypothetical protein
MNRTNRRNTDTSNANSKRNRDANEFALMIIQKLDELEVEYDYKFESLKARAFVLNLKGIKTKRGCDWSSNSVKRVLERVENLA